MQEKKKPALMAGFFVSGVSLPEAVTSVSVFLAKHGFIIKFLPRYRFYTYEQASVAS
jgi:hypothetical protein